MAKVRNKNFVVDVGDNITFIDQYGNEHIITWDAVNNRYYFVDGDIEANRYVNATNAHVENRQPLPTDIDYLVPTIWLDSVSLRYYMLIEIVAGVANWSEVASGTVIAEDPRLTINNGTPIPVTPNIFDAWIILDEQIPV